MKAKELKSLLEQVNDDANILIEDTNGNLLQIVNGEFSRDGETDAIYLTSRQEFPDEWFKDGHEIRRIHGRPVILRFEALDDKLELNLGNEYGTKEVALFLYDGYAEGDGVRVEYPKLAELSDEQIAELDDLLGRRISESGFIGFDDVIAVMGKVTKYVPPVKRLDSDSSLICESVQNITLVAWPRIYGKDNPLDLDSNEVLSMFREWGEEFESWWLSHNQEWIDTHNYYEEVEAFAESKAKEYLKNKLQV